MAQGEVSSSNVNNLFDRKLNYLRNIFQFYLNAIESEKKFARCRYNTIKKTNVQFVWR
jgi:hypothetical protein